MWVGWLISVISQIVVYEALECRKVPEDKQ